MRIGALAQEAGVSSDTLRFYEKQGLIRSQRSENGYRVFAPETAQLVIYIRTANRLGFTLAEISGSMLGIWGAADPDAAVAALLMEKIRLIDERIADMQRLRQDLAERVGQQCPLSRDAAAGAPPPLTPQAATATRSQK
jgi:DNA-binding transcriptional MerR regulator